MKEVNRGIMKEWSQSRFPDHVNSGAYWFRDRATSGEYWFRLWRRVWPVERQGVHWWDDWESRPLELQTDASVVGRVGSH